MTNTIYDELTGEPIEVEEQIEVIVDFVEPLNQIYARTNGQGVVVKVFSTAFEQPLATDYLIGETQDRHGANAYQVIDENGIYNYELVNGKLLNRDKTTDTVKLKNQMRIDELKCLLANTDYKAIKYAEGELTLSDYANTKAQRKAWRDEINRLEK